MVTISLIILAVLGVVALIAKWGSGSPGPGEPERFICPVLRSPVCDPASASSSWYKGKTYYFCCDWCKPIFDSDPERFVHKLRA